jgi:hypothetical protein
MEVWLHARAMVGMYAKKKISAFVKNQIPVKDIVPY